MNSKSIFFFLIILAVGCKQKDDHLFKEVPPLKSGITFQNSLIETDDNNILDYLYFYNGGGVAIGDINNDNLPDIYFSSNQNRNELYLNKGNLTFENITEKSGVKGESSWNTGAVMGDVNGDGLLDIYVCAVVGLNGFYGHNELFINNGDLTFTESSTKYGLDLENYSSNAAFLDYDLDGDLDLYLLNHAIHTEASFGKASIRNKRNFESGDKLLKNENGIFVDVSDSSGIYGGANGYGLGITVSDFNQDGFPDLYIGNDFHEDDYYYLNNGDGTFTESLEKYFGHTSRFSMGSDVADINHDGHPDLISLDMLPSDEKILKSSDGDENFQIQNLRIKDYGYHYQFSRNMLYLNQSDGSFSEIALQSGVAATDWSWSALFADYNQDGEQDLFISNGIPKRPNDLDYINFISNEEIKSKINNTNLIDQKALNLMPPGKVANKIFKGSSQGIFEDKSSTWIPQNTTVSGASAYGDLDNDGDLDLVVNNLNELATVYENKTNHNSNYLKLKIKYSENNIFGIGTKVLAYSKGKLQYKELYTVRGFQSSSEPIIHFGFGSEIQVDSLKIVWPDLSFQTIKNIKTNQTLEIKPANTEKFDFQLLHHPKKTLFQQVSHNLGIDFVHKEDSYSDFNRQKLIPYQLSDRGPATSVADINNDGKDDIFFGGSKYIPSEFFIQEDSSFVKKSFVSVEKDSIKEDVSSLIMDLDNNGSMDLIIGSGGADFYGKMQPLNDSYYSYKDGDFKGNPFPEMFDNASVILPIDFDDDGDVDLFIGNQTVTSDFGRFPDCFLLKNNNGEFSISQKNTFKSLGMVTDAIANDFDGDGDLDIIAIGEWMSPKFFSNDNGVFKLSEVLMDKDLNGLWQSIAPFDIDEDGDTDYLLGNWGLNSKYEADKNHPLKMFYSDFDNNGTTETVICIYKADDYYPVDNFMELSSQLPFLRKKFNTYKSFSGKSITSIFENDLLKKANILSVSTLASGYLKNTDGKFEFVAFDLKLQTAPITAFLSFDFDGDSKKEILMGGNYFGVKPYQGRFDSFSGALLKNVNTDILLGSEIGLNFMFKSLRHLNIINRNKQPYLLATFNNDKAQVYKIRNN